MLDRAMHWAGMAALVYLFVHMGVFLLRMNGIEVGGMHYGK